MPNESVCRILPRQIRESLSRRNRSSRFILERNVLTKMEGSRRGERARQDGFSVAVKGASRARRFLINVRSRREMAAPINGRVPQTPERSRPCRVPGEESPIENR